MPILQPSPSPAEILLRERAGRPGWASIGRKRAPGRSEEHTSELQSRQYLHSFPTRRSSDLKYRRLFVRPRDWPISYEQFCESSSQRFHAKIEDCICRYCSPRLHRQRSCCGKELGGLGGQVLAEKGLRGGRFDPRARIPGVSHTPLGVSHFESELIVTCLFCFA